MSKYKGLFTFDVDNHKYLPIEQVDGIITDMDYHPKTEPLIKNEKIRKAVRAWAEANEISKLLVIKMAGRLEISDGSPHLIYISFHTGKETKTMDNLNDRTYYTLTELCGEDDE